MIQTKDVEWDGAGILAVESKHSVDMPGTKIAAARTVVQRQYCSSRAHRVMFMASKEKGRTRFSAAPALELHGPIRRPAAIS